MHYSMYLSMMIVVRDTVQVSRITEIILMLILGLTCFGFYSDCGSYLLCISFHLLLSF